MFSTLKTGAEVSAHKGGETLQHKKYLRNDGSGKVSTTVIAIVVVIVIVLVAVALYVVMTNNNDNEDQTTSGQEIAPGSMLNYSVSGWEGIQSFKMEYVGQSNDAYFIKSTIGIDTVSIIEMYMTQPKDSNEDYKIIGTQVMDTVDGKKTLDVVSFTSDGSNVTAFLDKSTGLPYKMDFVDAGWTLTLTDYKAVTQKSYKQSDSVGLTYEYTYTTVTGTKYKAKVECIADCLNGQYGMVYDFSSIGGPYTTMYFISNDPNGIPVDAVKSTSTANLNTMDGTKNVQLWTYTDQTSGIMFSIGYESASKTIYEFDLVFANVKIPFSLTSKNVTADPSLT